MYSVLNTISEYTYFYISKNIASYPFLLAFKIDDSLQCFRNHCLIIFFHHTTNTKPFEYFSEFILGVFFKTFSCIIFNNIYQKLFSMRIVNTKDVILLPGRTVKIRCVFFNRNSICRFNEVKKEHISANL